MIIFLIYLVIFPWYLINQRSLSIRFIIISLIIHNSRIKFSLLLVLRSLFILFYLFLFFTHFSCYYFLIFSHARPFSYKINLIFIFLKFFFFQQKKISLLFNIFVSMLIFKFLFFALISSFFKVL